MVNAPPSAIKITECPRDAMQGIPVFIPTQIKAAYINLLLQVGFDTIDFGSFVSPRAIPQMQDTAGVLNNLDLNGSKSKLLAIIANYKGAEDACRYKQITYLGYPFSISETFQRRNANATISEAFETVKQIKRLCADKGKELLVYISMGFGNPYGDAWSVDMVQFWAEKLINEDIKIISLADTVGMATAEQVSELFPLLTRNFPGTEFGLHLHAAPSQWREKIAAAYSSGCRRFDAALKGYGGCPMAADALTGNIATENLVDYLGSQNERLGLNLAKLHEAMEYTRKVFV